MSKWKIAPLTLPLALLCMVVGGCDKYSDDLQNLGKRVEKLEDSLLVTGTEIENLRVIIEAIETDGFISELQKNPDGTYTFKFNNGKTIVVHQGENGLDGVNGHDGKTAEELGLTVKEDADGKSYWWMAGDWVRDADRNKVLARGEDGKDGADNLSTFPFQTRIAPSTGEWEISTDGINWESTGVPANGKDGKDGKDESVNSDIVKYAIVDDVKRTVTFIMRDESGPYVVPLWTNVNG